MRKGEECCCMAAIVRCLWAALTAMKSSNDVIKDHFKWAATCVVAMMVQEVVKTSDVKKIHPEGSGVLFLTLTIDISSTICPYPLLTE